MQRTCVRYDSISVIHDAISYGAALSLAVGSESAGGRPGIASKPAGVESFRYYACCTPAPLTHNYYAIAPCAFILPQLASPTLMHAPVAVALPAPTARSHL